ncbi:ComEA family DNA-binding protein [Mariniflexile gromovii]|uniref:Helix-hairpin-helix domain-containing protein n=1 Tax=Mariniflexile gromovii TaxID=362523 RepID=A0ABS4BWX9_9FLAO|nr:helix-hairpin-helix domain-containing protein [Mariniflexile gromovii]MBP0905100.1 helix-hairpin-helix domain-containing protein [Mariniflexile gromovii]
MKSHFTFSKSQRNGIFLLIFLIVALQCLCFYVDFSSEELSINKSALAKYEKEIDSLRLIEIEERKPKIYPFNPNYITDYKGASLGMSNEEIDRLLAFRKQNKWINTTKQFQEVTKISDSLLDVLSPYFKFPDWVVEANQNSTPKPNYAFNKKPKTFAEKQDLNKATAQDLQKVNGIGEYYSERIIKLRNSFPGGFIDMVQLQDVYGLKPEVIEKISEDFAIKTPRTIKIIILNKATIDELVTIQHIDYNLAFRIVEQRQLREGFKSLDELKKVKDFPVNKIDIIKLYLSLD